MFGWRWEPKTYNKHRSSDGRADKNTKGLNFGRFLSFSYLSTAIYGQDRLPIPHPPFAPTHRNRPLRPRGGGYFAQQHHRLLTSHAPQRVMSALPLYILTVLPKIAVFFRWHLRIRRRRRNGHFPLRRQVFALPTFIYSRITNLPQNVWATTPIFVPDGFGRPS